MQSGITHMHHTPTKMGGGVAILDYDNDGWEDVYLTGGNSSDKLYRNLGNGQFQDVSVSSGIAEVTAGPQTFGVVTGDIDNDGNRDILVTTYWNSECLLFHNQGDGTFNYLPNAINDYENWKTAATFGDVNKDGYLDLYITTYVVNSGFIYDTNGNVIGFDHECGTNELYINNGNLTFTNATGSYGVGDEGCALAVAFSDYDNDTDVDLVLANDFGQYVVPNGLFQNNFPTNTFTNMNVAMNMDGGFYAMGVGIGDYDRDGDLDYYQTNIGRNLLSRNDGLWFTDVTTTAGVENDSINGLNTTSWAANFFDADNDAWPDLFVSNGEISAAAFIANEEDDPNKLFLNNSNGTFTDISASAGVDGIEISRGAAVADLDKDGRLDIMVHNAHWTLDSTNVAYYHNTTSSTNNWIAFKLEGVQSNRDAFGSHVIVVLNGISTIAEVDGGSSHISQNSSIVHFGLGQETLVDSVICTFPSGVQRILIQPAINQVHEVIEDVTTSVNGELTELGIRTVGAELEISATKVGVVTIQVFDLSGKLLKSRVLQVDQGLQQVAVLSDLAAGLYLIRVEQEARSKSCMITKF